MRRGRHISTTLAGLCAALLAAMLGAAALAQPAAAASSAVVLMYHRFDEPTHQNSSVSAENFDAQLAELGAGGYTVLPVPEIVAALKAGQPLPERTVGITVDDAYLSVYEIAWPRLKAAGFPLTLFVAPGPVDERRRGYMSWDQIRELAADGVTIGHHTMWHRRLHRYSPERVVREIEEASLRYEAELGLKPELFAYPYGEYSLPVRQAAVDAGFTAAFSQHSGAIHGGGDFFTLPRFPVADSFTDMARFRLVVNALPLPVTGLIPRDPILRHGDNPPNLGFTVDPALTGLASLTCYAGSRGKADLEILEPSRVEVRVAEPFPPGRARFNCTMKAGDDRWRWLGVQYIIPGTQGSTVQ